MFKGGSIPREVREFRQEWGTVLAAFQASVNPMSGALQHLPCEGGVLDQPVKTIEVWTFLRGIWMECMPKDGGLERFSGG